MAAAPEEFFVSYTLFNKANGNLTRSLHFVNMAERRFLWRASDTRLKRRRTQIIELLGQSRQPRIALVRLASSRFYIDALPAHNLQCLTKLFFKVSDSLTNVPKFVSDRPYIFHGQSTFKSVV